MFYFFLIMLLYILLPCFLYISVLCDSGWDSWLHVIALKMLHRESLLGGGKGERVGKVSTEKKRQAYY